MKNKLKHYLKLGILLFGVSIFIISCQKDDDLELIKVKQTQPNFLVTKVGKIEIEANKALKQKLSKLDKELAKHKTSNLNKTVYSSTYDFYVDTDYATYIENADATYHSYTFPILRTVETDSLENLLISLKPDGSYKTMIIIYATTALEKQMLLNGLPVDLTDKITQATFNDNGFLDTVFSKTTYCDDWDTETYCGCNRPDHPNGYFSNGEPCDCFRMLIQGSNNCHDDSGGSWTPPPPEDNGNQTNTNSNGTNNNQQGSGGTNNNTTDTTYPTGECQGHDCPEDVQSDPCDTLKNVTDNTNVQTAINNVKPQTESKKEFAYEIERKYNYQTEMFDYTTALKAGTNFATPVQVGGHIQGQVHNHPKNGLSIPSWGDIRWTYRCEENNTNKNGGTAYNIIVVNNPEIANSTMTYAVTINDFDALGTQIDLEMNNPRVLKETLLKNKLDKINKKFGKPFKGIEDNASALEQKFLEVYSNYGISLYKMNENTNYWEILTLENPFDPTNPNASNTVISEPCNN